MAKKKVTKKAPAKKKAATTKSNKVGRPTKYENINLKQVEQFCKLGATDADLAEFLEVAESTINLWKLKHPEFSESVTQGKYYSDEDVVASLYGRAIGEVREIKEQRINKDGDVVTLTKEVLVIPDVKAQEFWLKNRRPKEWRDKQEYAVTVQTLDAALD